MKKKSKTVVEYPPASGEPLDVYEEASASPPASQPAGEPHSKALLRRKAEAQFLEREGLSQEKIAALSHEEMGTILHELRVHQIELEMQNEELRRAQAALDASRARYFGLYDLAPVGYVTVTGLGLILEANLTAATLLDLTRLAMVKQPISRFIHKEDQDIYYKMHTQLMQTRAPQACELRMVRPDGTAIWTHLEATVSQYEGGEPEFRFTFSNITERNAAEARIERLTQLYAALSHSNQDIVHAASAEDLLPTICGDLVKFGGMKMAWIGMVDDATGMVHPVAAAGIGREYTDGIQISVNPGDPLGKGPAGTAIRENRPFWCHDFQNDPSTAPWQERGAQYGWSAIASLPLHREGKPVGALTLYSPDAGIFDEEAQVLLVQMASDISFALDSFAHNEKRKRAEEELLKKSSEVERFTYMVTHDLKSPLVTIKTFLGFLEKDLWTGKAEATAKDLAFIHGAADKMELLLNELLEFVRIGHAQNDPEAVPLQEIVKEATELVAGQIAKRHVRIEITRDPVWLHGDRVRLVEVFQNLLDNAVKFLGDQPDPRIEVGAETEGGEVVLFVRDNGKGIDLRHSARLFGLFEKLDPNTPGSGIGLAMVRRIIEAHGGKIRAESAGPGKGTTFRFTLAKTELRRPA